MQFGSYICAGAQLPEQVWQEVLKGLERVEGMMGAKLGDKTNPLLLSVRSGAAVRSLSFQGSSPSNCRCLETMCLSMVIHLTCPLA
jgi:hypothetical protein